MPKKPQDVPAGGPSALTVEVLHVIYYRTPGSASIVDLAPGDQATMPAHIAEAFIRQGDVRLVE